MNKVCTEQKSVVQLLQIEEVWLNSLLQEFSWSLKASIFGGFNTEFITALSIERKQNK